MTSKFLLKFCVVCFLGQSVLSITYTQAQEVLPLGRTAVNTVYGEVFGSASGGNATNYSINYERVVENVLALRVGVGCTLHNPRQEGFSKYAGSTFTVPLTASYLYNFNASSHNVEIGLGLATTFSLHTFEGVTDNGQRYSGYGFGYTPRVSGIVGYRFQPLESGLNLRAVFTPLSMILSRNPFPFAPVEVYGGISIGYTF